MNLRSRLLAASRFILADVWQGKNLVPIGRVGTGFPQKLLRWLEPRLKQLETDLSPFSAPIPRKSGRIIHYVRPGSARMDRQGLPTRLDQFARWLKRRKRIKGAQHGAEYISSRLIAVDLPHIPAF